MPVGSTLPAASVACTRSAQSPYDSPDSVMGVLHGVPVHEPLVHSVSAGALGDVALRARHAHVRAHGRFSSFRRLLRGEGAQDSVQAALPGATVRAREAGRKRKKETHVK